MGSRPNAATPLGVATAAAKDTVGQRHGPQAQDGTEEPTEAASEPEPPQVPTQPPAHFCQEHQTPFKQYHRGDNVWYSHKTPDGKWCREK